MNTFYSALVIDNNDPEKKGRIKIRVSPHFDGVSNENLPWALPVIQSNIVEIPQVDKSVWVIFQRENVYDPIYFGYIIKSNSFSEGISAEDYPDTIGILTPNAWVSVNRKTNKIEIKNPNNSIILNDSGLTIQTSGTANITSTGNCTIQSSSQVSITAPIINCN